MNDLVSKDTMVVLLRRWTYMIIAIVASLVLFTKPVLNFQDDKGIIYIRSFSMDEQTFYVTQTTLDNRVPEVTATMSIIGLYYCNKAMLWGCILCLLCFFSNRWRIVLATTTAIISGFYYVILAYYAIKMSDNHYATLYPNFMVIWPAIVCQMMVLTRQNVVKSTLAEIDRTIEENEF